MCMFVILTGICEVFISHAPMWYQNSPHVSTVYIDTVLLNCSNNCIQLVCKLFFASLLLLFQCTIICRHAVMMVMIHRTYFYDHADHAHTLCMCDDEQHS